jgi:hypothetical protein
MRIKTLFAAFVLLAAPMTALADQDSALAAVRAQPGVLDAQLDDRGSLWVVVKNDKIAWEQYAVFMCTVVRPHQARVFSARIIDVTSVGRGKKSSEWKQLAQANCSLL